MAQKAIFIDRDDTLIDDPGVLTTPEQIQLLPGAIQSLGQFKKSGYLVFIVTNQPCIANGDLTEIQLDEIHRKLRKMLAEEGASVDGIYYCPHDPNGTVKEYAIESDLRKPQPGMLLKAAKEHDIDLEQSWMIGDRFSDIRAGKAAGCKTILVDVPGKTREQKPDDPEPDRKAVNLREAVNIIRMFEFHQKARSVKGNTPPIETSIPSEPLDDEAAEESHELQTAIPETPHAATAVVQPAPATTETEDRDIESTSPPAENEPVVTHSDSKVYTAKKAPAVSASEPDALPADIKTHQMLEETLRLLKKNERKDLYKDEFSIFRLLAMLFQVMAGLCLIFSIWFWLSPERGVESVLIMIGYAAVLQLAVIAFMMYSSE